MSCHRLVQYTAQIKLKNLNLVKFCTDACGNKMAHLQFQFLIAVTDNLAILFSHLDKAKHLL